MPDRASHLAKHILERLESLESVLRDDSAANDREKDQRRQELVAKILAIYAGVTDGPTVQIITSAMPTSTRGQNLSDRERGEFAEFLRQRIRFE